MPLYEYKCKKCGHRFERIQSFSAPDVKECPICQSEVERLISAPAVQFKGSGFYSTDYASKPAASDSSSGDKGTSAKTESSSTPAPPASGSKSE
jgi:putative FmdB family regulatory protein